MVSFNITGVTNSSTYEIFHVVTQDNLQVCLVKTGPTIPFISSLELRPLNNNSYNTQSGSLMLYTRIYFPSNPLSFIRYDEDIHDRGWNAFTDNETTSISTDLPIDTSNAYDMPQAVMKTAAIPVNASKTCFCYDEHQEDIWFKQEVKLARRSMCSSVVSVGRNLKESGLTGTITSDISKLTQLKELDLSSNDLSGDIPAFFADMKLLKLINLSGNPKLNLTVPESLQERVNSKSLTLILGDTLNPTTLGGKTKKVPVLAIAVPVAGVFALVVILAIFFIVRKKRPRSNAAPRPPSVTTSLGKSETRPSNPSIITKDRRITYPEVLRMTNNFQRVLGKGGFGTVYHGNLDDAQVAVKMLSHSSAQGYKEFKAEVELLLRVHHRHLVGLVGYCDDGDNLALIYEYMANGDLRENMSGKRFGRKRYSSKHSKPITGKRGGNVLTWENRMQIAVEAAQGLEYLHNGCRPPMVHRDVKTTNILLNERSGAKLADFGLSRSFPIDGECHVSTVVAGTPGYLDPEYYRTNWLSEKSDVYSFGVVLLEIVTNQPVIDKTRERPHINEWVGFMLTKGDIRSIVDPKLMGDYDTNCAWKIVELALGCVNPSSNQRPTMAQVVMELNECVALEIVRRQGSQEMYSMGSVDNSLTSASEFSPGAR
ncbi:unnamed protein product [Brassica rapa subsp. trilocularis]